MNAVLGQSDDNHPLRVQFLKWQCLCRQIMMRENQGKPGDAIMPLVIVAGQSAPLGRIITILNKTPRASVLPELRHMAKKNMDPMQRRNQAQQFFSATYYQKHAEFSDNLTATFPPGSTGADVIASGRHCRLVFEAYGQRFDLQCAVVRLERRNPLFQATLAHNRLFNPALPDETEVLAFQTDWNASNVESNAA